MSIRSVRHRSLLALAAGLFMGCGDDGAARPDAPTVDGPDTDAAASTVSVHYGSAAGIAVSFADPDGMPTELVMTDSTGTATATVAAGSSATVIVPAGATTLLYVVLDLQPGDAVDFGGVYSQPTSYGMINFVMTKYMASYMYEVGVGADGNRVSCYPGAPATVTCTLGIDSTMLGPDGKVDAELLAKQNTLEPIAYQTIHDITPPAAGQTLEVMVTTWKTDFVTFGVALTNPPASSAGVSVDISPLADHRQFEASATATSLAFGETKNLVVGVAADAWDKYSYAVRNSVAGGAAYTFQFGVLATPGTITADLSAGLPLLHDGQISLPAGQTMPMLSLAADGTLSSAAGGEAFGTWMGAAGEVQAIVFGPAPSGSSVAYQLPRLPAAYANVQPSLPFAGTFQSSFFARGGAFPDARSFRETGLQLHSAATYPVGAVGYSTYLSAP